MNSQIDFGIVVAYWLRIFCRSAQVLPATAIIDFIEDGIFFDVPPRFEIEPSPDQSTWRRISVYYAPNRRPIQFERNIDDAIFFEELHEIADEWCALGVPRLLVERLQVNRQVIAIELSAGDLPDDAWMMIDALQAFLAQTLDGIIYAPDDGIYDEKLQRIHNIEDDL